MDAQKDGDSQVQIVVGIAASAGGLEAMSLLAQHLPMDLNCAYVLAQHMSPHHASVLPTLISRETRLNVKQVDGDMPLEPNTIYVPVPRTDIEVRAGSVHQCEPSGAHAEPKPSADRLFRSIAEHYGECSVGVVLSGTGSDGTYGVQAIREAGGINIAQDSSSAKYETMPSSAVESGSIDLVLSPRQIGEQLRNILKRPRDFSKLQALIEQPKVYDDIFRLLQAQTKVNFRHYKETTVSRRIQRRMIAMGFEDYGDYVEFCRSNAEELNALFRDLLISVTRFFRDADQFDALRTALADYIARVDRRPIRVWVPGCASGEEAYSIAFILCDLLGVSPKDAERNVQVFATDLDVAALARARAGVYPASSANGIPEEYLGRFTTRSDNLLRVRPEVRKLVLFSQHNVFQDPPFSEIDLVSFRNTMIYFENSLQDKVMSRILYALRPEGLLFLGTSENVGELEPYFENVAERTRLFRKRGSNSFDRDALVRFGLRPRTRSDRGKGRTSTASKGEDENDNLFEALANAVAPLGFLANEQKDLVRIYGDISAFTRVTDEVRGRLTTNTLIKELAQDAASLIPLCLKYGTARDGLWRNIEGHGFNRVRLHGYPVKPAHGKNSHVLVGIEAEQIESPVAEVGVGEEAAGYITYVENELADAREALQITMEELQTSNEELQSTNEELQSTNEELQSTNEELETSNEELQSTNEELITVNEELLINTDELNKLVVEQAAMLECMPVPLLAVDPMMNIKSASHRAIELFGLSSRGAHFGHISQLHLPWAEFPDLTEICTNVLSRQVPEVVEFAQGEGVNRLRVAPYFVQNNDLMGLIVVLEIAI
ncbi:chemotaxis protein CheB [Sagittula sp. SSi028]|uniref:chemotaxis protein CheB n=1 Tax=Sagittula sp. SSi028 TaxID=3400636 RepID=UPI003AF96412